MAGAMGYILSPYGLKSRLLSTYYFQILANTFEIRTPLDTLACGSGS
jgi:hypothetical protein